MGQHARLGERLASAEPGTFGSIVVRATDSNGDFAEKTLSLVILPQPVEDSFIDDFNRANGPVGNSWQAITASGYCAPTGTISNNQFTMAGCAGNLKGFVRPQEVADASVEVKFVGATEAAPGIAMVARLKANGDHYIAYAAQSCGYTRIIRRTNGGTTSNQVAPTAAFCLTPGDILKLSVQGTQIIFSYKRAGVETVISTATDSGITGAGKFGMSGDTASAQLDDFKME